MGRAKQGEEPDGAAHPPGKAAPSVAERPPRHQQLSAEAAGFYEELWEPARAGCLRLLRRLGCARAEAEEVFSDTYVTVMEKVDPIERGLHEAQMVNLMKTACRHRLINLRRREGVLKEVAVPEVKPTGAENRIEAPDELAERGEAIAIGEEAVLSLSPLERMVFLLRYEQGLSPEEVRECVPQLSEHGYRRAIQRANAKALAAYRRIESGKRCGELGQAALASFLAGTAELKDAASIEAHLKHCLSCRHECAEMRGYLHDLAGTLALLGAAGSFGAAAGTLSHPLAALGELPALLGQGARAIQERIREVALRAGGLSGSGGGSGISQVVGVSGVKVVVACTGVAVTCVAAGVVPGVSGLSFGDHSQSDGADHRAQHVSDTPLGSELEKGSRARVKPTRAHHPATSRRAARKRKRQAELRRHKRAIARERSEAAPESQGGASEFGVEPEAAAAPAPPPEPVESTPPPAPSGGGGSPESGSGSEFGL